MLQHRFVFATKRLSKLLLLGMALASSPGCGGYITEEPTAEISMNPHEDVYRLLSTSKMYGRTPTRVDVSETLATLHLLSGSTIITIPIPFGETDVQLKHNNSGKWVVDLYKSNGKRLIRLEAPNAEHANELASVLLTLQVFVSD